MNIPRRARNTFHLETLAPADFSNICCVISRIRTKIRETIIRAGVVSEGVSLSKRRSYDSCVVTACRKRTPHDGDILVVLEAEAETVIGLLSLRNMCNGRLKYRKASTAESRSIPVPR